MTRKKYRKKEFKRLVSLGWPRYVASRIVRGKTLASLGYKNLDDLTLDRQTYYNSELNTIVYISQDETWEQVKVTKPLHYYYD